MHITSLKTFRTLLIILLACIFMVPAKAGRAASSSGFPPPPDQIQYAPLHFELPQAHRVVLDNGIVLYILENHELPLVNIKALVKTGTMHDPSGKEGTAELTAYGMRTGERQH